MCDIISLILFTNITGLRSRDREGGGCHQEIVLAALPEFEYFKEIGNRGFYINLIFK